MPLYVIKWQDDSRGDITTSHVYVAAVLSQREREKFIQQYAEQRTFFSPAIMVYSGTPRWRVYRKYKPFIVHESDDATADLERMRERIEVKNSYLFSLFPELITEQQVVARKEELAALKQERIEKAFEENAFKLLDRWVFYGFEERGFSKGQPIDLIKLLEPGDVLANLVDELVMRFIADVEPMRGKLQKGAFSKKMSLDVRSEIEARAERTTSEIVRLYAQYGLSPEPIPDNAHTRGEDVLEKERQRATDAKAQSWIDGFPFFRNH